MYFRCGAGRIVMAMKTGLLTMLDSLWLHGLRIIQRITNHQLADPAASFPRGRKQAAPFISGINLPWLSYGNDFGSSVWNPRGGISQKKNRMRLDRIFRRLKEQRIGCIRWFLLGDGRSGILTTARGIPAGVDDRFFNDIDAAVELAAKHKLKIIFVLLDYLLFSPAQVLNGVQMGGRRRWIASRVQHREFVKHVLEPILKRYGRSPAILAWDILNEPEWATLGLGGAATTEAIPAWQVRRFLKRTVELVHRFTGQPATVGLANAAGLPLVKDIGLDLFQVHWYDRFDAAAPLDRPVRNLGLDRPLLLGEFPTRNTARSRSKIVALARRHGYCGALAWSLLGNDRSSGMALAARSKTRSISG